MDKKKLVEQSAMVSSRLMIASQLADDMHRQIVAGLPFETNRIRHNVNAALDALRKVGDATKT